MVIVENENKIIENTEEHKNNVGANTNPEFM